jgi:FtsZ-binding cell division protein ZapB
MVLRKTLFDDDQIKDPSKDGKQEAKPLEKLKSFEDKISTAIERVKILKEEKTRSERKIRDLEKLLDEKSQEAEYLRSEKNAIKNQLEALLAELETLEAD